MSKSKNATKLVVEHLERLNRPDTLQSISNYLIDVGKSDVLKALDRLIDDARVIEKINNKSKIFYLNQKKLNKGLQIDANELDRLKMEKQETLKSIENSVKKKEIEFRAFDGKLSNKQLSEEIRKSQIKLEEKENEFENIEARRQEKKNEDKKNKYEHEFVAKECRKRKRIVKDIVDALAEFQPKTKKQLLSEIGIEFYK